MEEERLLGRRHGRGRGNFDGRNSSLKIKHGIKALFNVMVEKKFGHIKENCKDDLQANYVKEEK